ncbi:dnaJ homolog subfamily C member 3-like [Amphibalanus amphitrite]|uniref:dnaJ homolog subfamily C member 3-like n=1 Tax=Amphibalanus amphitrite TaxID=1232801 RepID=UPI001C9196B1|nr:dnaJ homolog subfamily C member 3-like [Amphibalanus amphitrite]
MTDLAHLQGYLASIWLFFLAAEIHINDATSSLSSADVDQHLEMGLRLLSQGQLQDALTHFHAAIDADPQNYLSYYRRATVYLALGKAKQALPDLQQVLKMKPDFLAARLQRGNVHLKLGNLDEAHIDFEDVLRRDPSNAEALQAYSTIDQVRADVREAQQALHYGDHHTHIALLSRVLEVCSWSAPLRQLRADSYVAVGDLIAALSDLRTTTKLVTDNRAGHLQIAKLHYRLGEAHESLSEVRECLKLDQDDKQCHEHYKKVKKVVKALDNSQEHLDREDFASCSRSASKVLDAEPTEPAVRYRGLERMCTCQVREGASEAVSTCTRAIELDREPRIYCERAEAYLNDDLFDEAIRDYQQALEMDEGYQRAKEGLGKAQKKQKLKKKRDYYKILGVKKTASKKEINKAYRKLAQQWHPDNFATGDEKDKKKAEAMFIDIAAAKEVLSDPDKRRKFDAGEDPLDPESEAGRGFNPFEQGFHGFHGGHGGGPFHFKFHFN